MTEAQVAAIQRARADYDRLAAPFQRQLAELVSLQPLQLIQRADGSLETVYRGGWSVEAIQAADAVEEFLNYLQRSIVGKLNLNL